MAPMSVSVDAGTSRPDHARATRTLTVTGLNHALHDGYTDLIYILLPVWQAEFGLSYGMLALLRGLYSGVMAALQVPACALAPGPRRPPRRAVGRAARSRPGHGAGRRGLCARGMVGEPGGPVRGAGDL